MKYKKQEIIVCVLALIFSVLSSAIGYGFLGGAGVPFATKLLCGFIFISTPLFVVQLLLLIWRKDQ